MKPLITNRALDAHPWLRTPNSLHSPLNVTPRNSEIRSPHIDNYRPSSVRAGYLFHIVVSLVRYLLVPIYYISDISVCCVRAIPLFTVFSTLLSHLLDHPILAYLWIPDDRWDGRVPVSLVIMIHDPRAALLQNVHSSV